MAVCGDAVDSQGLTELLQGGREAGLGLGDVDRVQDFALSAREGTHGRLQDDHHQEEGGDDQRAFELVSADEDAAASHGVLEEGCTRCGGGCLGKPFQRG